jgi:hypothetical protein
MPAVVEMEWRVSPDGGAATGIGGIVSAAARRIRLLAIAEAAGWGAAAAAIWPFAGALVAASILAWRWRATARGHILQALERARPDVRNLFITADELEQGILVAKPSIRDRVFDQASAKVQAIDLSDAFVPTPVWRAVWFAGVAWAIALALGFMRGHVPGAGSPGRSGVTGTPGTSTGAGVHITVTIEPPAYTGLPASTVLDPEQLQAIEGAVLIVSVDSGADQVSLEHDGATRPLARDSAGRFATRVLATKTGFIVVTAGKDERRTLPLVVSPDALPAVRVTAPGRDLVYGGGNPRIAFETRATDDFGLRSLVLRYTKVSGSGEQFEFQEGEIPLTMAKVSPREWTGTASRALADLALQDGDMLVYRAVAADARPGDGTASSDAFFIEVSKLGVAAGDAFTLPEEESRYALSQQMLIIKTERLQQRRATMPPAELGEAALNLAVEQRMIRAEFIFMLGGEVEDEEVEAQQSTELQEGRLQNRGQRDLRTATIAMSQAEKLLTGVNIAEALVAERAAVTALQRAFARDRYILRALATRTQLDATRRLTANLDQARDWRRSPPALAANRRAALLQDLLRGIAALGDGGAAFRERALVLAEEAIRIDPAAASLRAAATELQRAAAAAGDAVARSKALSTATVAAVTEARREHADPSVAVPVLAPALNGAFTDALRGRR